MAKETQESWLNGWSRQNTDDTMLLGCGVVCVGCGKEFGVVCVAFSDDWVSPEKTPEWPFKQATCPLCELREEVQSLRVGTGSEDKLTKRMLLLARARHQ